MEKSNIQYINKTYDDFKKSLKDLTKTYFPNTYNDFSEDSIGLIFMEQAAMVADVLSFYQDTQIQENFLLFAKEKKNLYAISYQLGYKPKVTFPSIVEIDVFQQIPSKIISGSSIPDFDYALYLSPETVLQSVSTGKSFLIQDAVDFSYSSSFNPTKVQVYSKNVSTSQPEYYLLSKKASAISAEVKSTTYSVGERKKFLNIEINDNNIIGILDIYDSDGNKWHEVDYLAQDSVFEDVKSDNSEAEYILKIKKVNRRFTSRFTHDNTLVLEFGSGTSNYADEEIVPNPDNVGIGLIDSKSKLNYSYDSLNFLFTNTYGLSPSNTTLTIRYLVGGGFDSNVPSNDISNISSVVLTPKSNLNIGISSFVRNSIEIKNTYSAKGGRDGETVDEIRLNALSNFTGQSRVVTKNDYLIRALSLPAKYGGIAKAYVDNEPIFQSEFDKSVSNISLYLLGYDVDKKITNVSELAKKNVRTYLSQYRMITDSINIKDAYYVNFTVDFDIIVLPTYNNKEVLLKSIDAVKDFFKIDSWQINQPIILSELYNRISMVSGVQSIIKVDLKNISGGNYSPYSYDMTSAKRNNIIYPSIDPSIFEIRFPDIDIKGRIITY